MTRHNVINFMYIHWGEQMICELVNMMENCMNSPIAVCHTALNIFVSKTETVKQGLQSSFCTNVPLTSTRQTVMTFLSTAIYDVDIRSLLLRGRPFQHFRAFLFKSMTFLTPTFGIYLACYIEYVPNVVSSVAVSVKKKKNLHW